MRKVNLDEIEQLASESRDSLWEQAQELGREPKGYLHWSAGHYGQFYDDYHINIDSDGSIYISTDDFSEVLAHTYHRNTGAIGIALACCAFATSEDLGDEPPTAKQIESMAQVVMTLANALDIPLDKEHFMSHGRAADNEDGIQASEPYGPKTTCERWDLEYLGTEESPVFNPYDEEHRGDTIIVGKANWYNNQGKYNG